MSNTQSSKSWDFIAWCRGNPLAATLGGTIVCTFIYFFGLVPVFVNSSESAMRWAWLAWNPEQDQEHSKVVPLIFAWLVWHHWDEIVQAPKSAGPAGLFFVGAGILSFLLSTRCLQPRLALIALPFLLFGSIYFLWGKNVARLMLFPCVFLIFLIPFGVIQQWTFKLQFIITGIVSIVANVFGIHVQAMGTTLSGTDGSFHFEVAEGCSGIHSIIAITMLTTVFMHLTQRVLWKKIVIVLSSVVFAIIGNIGRILTILIVARLFNADIAGGKYHEYSGFIIYPFAVLAMIGLSMLLNMQRHPPGPDAPGGAPVPAPAGPKPPSRKNDYDY